MTIIDIEEQLYYYGARYLGDTRIVTKLNSGENPTYQEESRKQYYYHSDHLGSAAMISDHKGDEYQRIEYTPYGETWVEKTQNTGLEYLPYKFTAKELDEETGLYYYGARYLDPKYSMWISTDPALGEYMPQAGSDTSNLPGMGGIFNHINSNLYHYAGNNPVKYIDPDGRADFFWNCFSNNDMPPTQKDFFDATMNYCEQQFSIGMQTIQNNLSSAMNNAMNVAGDAVVAGAEFMSEYGGVIAVACYASGNIGVGIIIDGVSLACDISLTATKFNNNEISGQQAMLDIASTVASTAIGSKCGKNFTKAANRVLLDPKTTEILSNCISDFVSQGFTTLVNVQTE